MAFEHVAGAGGDHCPWIPLAIFSAFSFVKLPVIIALPSVIESRTRGAKITLSSSRIATGFP